MKLKKKDIFFINFGILVFLTNITICLGLFSDNLNYNPFITKYDKLKYDTKHLNDQHTRAKRSLDNNIYLNFNSHEREFKIKLRPASRVLYGNRNVELVDKHLNVDNLINFYEGNLVDEPFGSYVSGTIIDGIFYGTIESDKYGKYFIESSKRYNHSLDAHSIIYHEDNINLDRKKIKRSVHSNTHNQSRHDDDDDDANDEHFGCGASRDHIKDWMKKEQKRLYDEKRKTEGFDPFSYIDKEKFNLDDDEHNWNKYSREANEKYKRKKRDTPTDTATDTPEFIRNNFPEQRTMCNMYLRVDPQLHSEIFNNEGGRDQDKTVAFLLFYLNKHVEALNSIYNGLQFFDANKKSYYVGLQFMIYRTKIITEEQCSSKGNLTEEELKLCEPYLDVSTFLNYVSLDNFDDYCLAYTFTARDFTDGTLGLAWVAKLTGSVGGVCERRTLLQSQMKSLNSGIVTVVNYQARVPEAVSQITFAHEVGHNFGSEHDPDDTNCSPGISRGGNFIMYRRATTGTDKNNRNFSQCSKDQMGPIVHALVLNPTRFCFKQYNGSLCGNGIVEPGEECDCGYSNECKESKCCYDADDKSGNKCKLKPNAKCSPSQGACCEYTCNYSSSTTVCMQSDECIKNVTCTGHDAYCPRNSSVFFHANIETTCNSGTQVCKNGTCSGSICEKFGMVQCYLEGNLKDKSVDKAVLCHLACIGEKTGNKCVDSFKIDEMFNSATNSGFILKPGSPCIGTSGYCDIFSKCRSVDGEGPLSRLKNLIFSEKTLTTLRDLVTTYWWAAILMVVGILVFMVAFIKVCSVHTPSSNPRKPPALKFSETLRRPIKRIPHPHLHRSSTHQTSSSNNPANHQSKHQSHLVSETSAKQKSKMKSTTPIGSSSNHPITSSNGAGTKHPANKKSKDQPASSSSTASNNKHGQHAHHAYNQRVNPHLNHQQQHGGVHHNHHNHHYNQNSKTANAINKHRNHSSEPLSNRPTSKDKNQRSSRLSIFNKRHKSDESAHHHYANNSQSHHHNNNHHHHHQQNHHQMHNLPNRSSSAAIDAKSHSKQHQQHQHQPKERAAKYKIKNSKESQNRSKSLDPNLSELEHQQETNKINPNPNINNTNNNNNNNDNQNPSTSSSISITNSTSYIKNQSSSSKAKSSKNDNKLKQLKSKSTSLSPSKNKSKNEIIVKKSKSNAAAVLAATSAASAALVNHAVANGGSGGNGDEQTHNKSKSNNNKKRSSTETSSIDG